MSILSSKKIRILVAEDDATLQILYKRTLENDYPNADIFIAEDGDSAITQFLYTKDKYPYDIVITDFQMPPGMNGIELAEEINCWDETIPIILVTGTPPKETPDVISRILVKGSSSADITKVIQEELNL